MIQVLNLNLNLTVTLARVTVTAWAPCDDRDGWDPLAIIISDGFYEIMIFKTEKPGPALRARDTTGTAGRTPLAVTRWGATVPAGTARLAP